MSEIDPTTTRRPHLVLSADDRGLKRLPPLIGTWGAEIHVYESSNVAGPYVWLAVLDRDNPESSAHVEMPARVARDLAEQLLCITDNTAAGAAGRLTLQQVLEQRPSEETTMPHPTVPRPPAGRDQCIACKDGCSGPAGGCICHCHGIRR